MAFKKCWTKSGKAKQVHDELAACQMLIDVLQAGNNHASVNANYTQVDNLGQRAPGPDLTGVNRASANYARWKEAALQPNQA